jgi:hypothetical protein
VKLLNIAYTPSAEVHFTRRDLWLMMECSRRHYDHLCRSISSPGQGSFLFGWWNGYTLTTDKRGYTEHVTIDQLDTLMKVLEGCQYLRKKADQQDAFGIGLKLKRLFFHLQEQKCVEPAEKGVLGK